ncbi:allatostatin-A receptor-like [Diadema antillarum]|uniref:allatostatin-A receptor-like n=1 Tax=Diadema antillarum TaxID=105358 RepID=UPI003A8B2377
MAICATRMNCILFVFVYLFVPFNFAQNVTPSPAPFTEELEGIITTLELETTAEEGDLWPAWSWHPIRWSWNVILQLISAIIGIIGNGLVIVVVFNRRVDRNSTDILIGALAIADFFSSVFIIPLPQIRRMPLTPLGEFYCRMIDTSAFMWCCVAASVFTLTTISLERFAAVVYPFQFRRLFSKRRTIAYILAIWLVSFAIYIPFHIFFKKIDAASHSCVLQRGSPGFQMFNGLSSVIIKFFCPFLIMVASQTMTAITLQRQSRIFMNSAEGKNKASLHLHVARQRVIEMLLIVVIIFVICWGPSQCAFLLFNLHIISPSYVYSPLNRIFTVLGFYNSCANPIIYTVRNVTFRSAVKSILTREKKENVSVFGISPSAAETASTLAA